MSITEKIEYYLTDDYKELESDEKLDESIKEWVGIDKKKNKIHIEQEGSNIFHVSVDDKKGNNIVMFIKQTLQDAIDSIKGYIKGKIKWSKDKIKKKNTPFKDKKSGVLVGRMRN